MTIAPIPFANAQSSGLDAISGAGELSMNVVSDSMGTVHRRPGIAAYSGAPTTAIDAGAIQGLYETDDAELFAVGSGTPDRVIYKVTAGGALNLGNGATGSGLNGTKKPVFAETETLVLVAGGTVMQMLTRDANLSQRLVGLGSDEPPQSSHVIAAADRAIANDLLSNSTDLNQSPTKVRYSEPSNSWPLGAEIRGGGYQGWDLDGLGTSGYYSCDARPDPLVALAENSNEIFNFGSLTLEVGTLQVQATSGTNAGKMMFSRTCCIEVGCAAPYSVVKVDQKFAWIDHLHRAVISDGRTFQVISTPIQRVLDEIDDVSDCFGYRIVTGYLDLLVWTFPSSGRTFAYQDGTGWAQWSGWAGNWKPFAVTAATTSQGTSTVVVGTSDGRIGKLSLSTSTDFGEPIHAFVATGYISRATAVQKLCRCVRLGLKRGAGAATPGPSGWLKFRDRPGDEWTPIPIDFGGSGDTEIVIPFYGLGSYRARQWAFEFSGTDELTLVSATEEFDLLGT